MSKTYYLIIIIFTLLFGVYFLATQQWVGAFMLIVISLPLNIKWFIEELE